MKKLVLALALVYAAFTGKNVLAEGIDAYTKLLLHCDGADAATSFSDSSAGAKTVTNNENYDPYTKLMIHFEGDGNSFVDGATSKLIIPNGSATQTTAQYKFGNKSSLFSGANDYLSLADSDDWYFGNGNFTIDLWVRFTELPTPGNMSIFMYQLDGYKWWHFGLMNLSGVYKLRFQTAGATGDRQMLRGWTPTLNTWYHVAVVRSGDNHIMFVNGVQLGDVEVLPGTSDDSSAPLWIGNSSPDSGFKIWMDELRISKGIARWTSNFTAPSSAYGQAATVVSQKKFGSAGGEFKGGGDYLTLADSEDWNFGTGDFTIDFWAKVNALPEIAEIMGFFGQGSTSNDHQAAFLYNNAGTTHLYWEADTGGGALMQIDVVWTPLINTWYHFAYVRSGTLWTIYRDGVMIGNVVSSETVGDYTTLFYIGEHPYSSGPLNGWIDELRISKGIARWISNFTPPVYAYGSYYESVPMQSGWHMIGLPILSDVHFNDVYVSNGIETRPFSEVADIWIQDPLIGYDNSRSAYFSAGLKEIDDANFLRPWNGYWIYNFVSNLTLIVPTTVGTESQATAAHMQSAGAGELTLETQAPTKKKGKK